METLVVGFSRPKVWKPFAQLIMWAYSIPYDHVYIKIRSQRYDRDLIYQASGLVVNFMSPILFNQNNVTVKEFEFSISKETKIKTIQKAIDRVGTPYGIKEIFGLAYVRLMSFAGKIVKNPFADGDATYVCCELVAEILEESLDLKFDRDRDDIDPKYLYDLLEDIKQNNTSNNNT